jgi:hypothetical protein
VTKTTCYYAVLVGVLGLASLFGCSSDEEADAAAEAVKPDPVPGSAATAPSGPQADGGAELPALNLPDPGTTPTPPVDPPADAGPDVAVVENDPGDGLGERVFGLDEGGRLVSFRVNKPDTVSVKPITGLAAGERLLNIDFRPVDSTLYGLGSGSRLYTINIAAGVATVVGDGMAFTPAVTGQAHGFDFNPVPDKIRVHTDVDQNLRLDPITGKVTMLDGTLAFAAADVNAGQSPNIVATAYTNNVTPAPATTMLYGIDSTRNLLVRLPTPNDGMVETVGALGIDVDQVAGFDISRLGVAYTAMRVGAETALYTIDLTTGAATKTGVIAYPVGLTSISVQP